MRKQKGLDVFSRNSGNVILVDYSIENLAQLEKTALDGSQTNRTSLTHDLDLWL